jgi:alcohol dehydrogenase class IV
MTGGAPQRFEFATAGQVIFGAGTLPQIGPIASDAGRKAFVTTGSRGNDLDRLVSILSDHGVSCQRFAVTGEPTVEMVLQGCKAARESGCDLVIGFGGGSALDAAKAVAALLTNPGDPLDYLEVVGRGLPLTQRPAPFLAIPTTAGTGSEVTRNAVLAVPEQQVKVSLRSPMMLARTALVDPELTYSLPPEVTAATGMDALAQVIEPYVSRRANLLTDIYCRDGITRAARSLRRAFHDGADPQAREDMAFASLMGGLALANAGLGAVHGFAGALGGMYAAPHGAVCAALLPTVVRVNARALAGREPAHPALQRYAEIAVWVTGDTSATIDDLANWLEELRAELHIPGLQAYGVALKDLPVLVEKGMAASSMRANPITLSPTEAREILERSL